MVSATREDTSARTLDALRETEAFLEGHFLLSSGRHAARYFQCARLLQYPDRAAAVCADLAQAAREHFGEEQPFDVVVGPALGAVTLGYELARALGVRGVFAERAPEGGFALRRGFRIESGERILVAEDVVTTGKSVNEVLAMLGAAAPARLAVASIVNRSGGASPFGEAPYLRLADVEVPSWDEGSCPLCASGEGGPPIKPGSRPGLG